MSQPVRPDATVGIRPIDRCTRHVAPPSIISRDETIRVRRVPDGGLILVPHRQGDGNE